MSFVDFQDGRYGGHLGYRHEIILANLNIHVAPMPSTKFGLNLIAEQNDFNNSESLSRSNASH